MDDAGIVYKKDDGISSNGMDLEFSLPVNLRCPMSGSRMKVAGRFKPCAHMGCFDLHTFVELNQRSRKWQCPICLKNYSLEHVIIDPYFNRIGTLMRDCGEDVTEIDVNPDGSWRAKNEHERKDLAQWHSPSGSLHALVDEARKSELEDSKIKQEVLSEGHSPSGSLQVVASKEGGTENLANTDVEFGDTLGTLSLAIGAKRSWKWKARELCLCLGVRVTNLLQLLLLLLSFAVYHL